MAIKSLRRGEGGPREEVEQEGLMSSEQYWLDRTQSEELMVPNKLLLI